ncbi:uncharacterized protein LOC135200105 [Macrobrachium nipponense]|uniref:uncharacterized protein LOC135200105 n=1 Tax=Macrobrachium nipponense TaxID=159736 RepID=UPI0030C855EE
MRLEPGARVPIHTEPSSASKPLPERPDTMNSQPLRTKNEQLIRFINDSSATWMDKVASCREASDRIKSHIQKNTERRKDILQINRSISNEISRMKTITERNDRKEQYLENKNTFLGDHLKTIQEKEDNLQSLMKELARATDFKAAAPYIDNIEEVQRDLESYLRYLEDYLPRGENISEDIEKNVLGMNKKFEIIQDVLSSPEEGCKDIAAAETAELDRNEYLIFNPSSDRHDNIPSEIMAEHLRDMNNDMERLIRQQKLFAIQSCQGKKRLAEIWFSQDNELLLGHLTEQKLPPYAYAIKHSEVMKLLDPASGVTFLELGNMRSTLGSVYIRLLPDNIRCQQFLLLCTGEKGRSYAKTRLLEVGNKHCLKREYVRFGDYEKNDGTGGRALFSDITREKEKTDPCRCLAGAVLGEVPGQMETGSQFIICTSDTPDSHHEICAFSAFGKVYKGLDVLTNAISQLRNLTDISIQRCGVILSVNNSRKRSRKFSRKSGRGGFYESLDSVQSF